MTTTKDKYDKAIEYLTANPREIFNAWGCPNTHVAGCLFMPAGPTTGFLKDDVWPMRKDGLLCGCLTTIRQNGGHFPRLAWTDELTQEILQDTRIPDDCTLITVSDLPVFAEWQRRLDKEIRGL